MRQLITLITALIVAGCATQAQHQYENITTQYNSAMSAMNSCFVPLLSSPAVRRLENKFILENDDPNTVQKLADKSYADDSDVKDIIEFSVIRKPCYKLAIEKFSLVHPEYVASLAKVFTEADIDLAMAVNRELEIGELNRRTLERVNRWQVEFGQISQRITSQLNQAHQYESQQRQKAAQMLQTWAYQQQELYSQQQILNAINRPYVTNCHYVGNILSCTSF
jgi:hypothetical protein